MNISESNNIPAPQFPRLLIVGGRGYIGKQLAAKAASKFDVHCTASSDISGYLLLDLAKPADFDYEQIHSGDVCLLTAAISSPDICASKHDYAWSVNVVGTSEFIERALRRGARVVFFSSDTVYGQREMAFDEQSDCAPAGEYAAMKHEIEKRFLGNSNFKTARLSYVFSRDDKFTRYLVGCVQRSEVAEVFHPFYRAIIHREDVVDGILALAGRWKDFPQPIVNFGGPEVLSRVDFAETLQQVALFRLQIKCIEPVGDFFEKRPRMIAMSSPILPKLLGRPSRSLSEAVRLESALDTNFMSSKS